MPRTKNRNPAVCIESAVKLLNHIVGKDSKREKNGKMDYDMFQPCFYENESSMAPGSLPNEDMWKKFELLPTPPLSPRRDDDFDLHCLDMEDFNLIFDEFFEKEIPKMTFSESPPPNLNSNLIQDCMWSGDSGRYPTGDKSALASDVNSNDCVDPAAVFPYPIHNLNGAMSETKLHSLGIETPSDSDEEIDVVTVEKKQQLQQVPVAVQTKKTVFTVQSVKTERIDGPEDKFGTAKTTVTVKVKVDCPTDEHPYSLPVASLKRARSVSNSPSASPLPSKRLKRELSDRDIKKVCQKLRAGSGSNSNSSSRNSSDSEDFPEGKRTQHNVLERKRRNDLKFSFFSLRDSVPDLIKQERAPKVQILKKASEYIQKLTADEQRLESERDLLQEKHEQLRRTLEQLHSREF